jgi:hypothetical protein
MLNWEEILKSPELVELIFNQSGLSKEEWDEIIKEEDYDSIEEHLGELLRYKETIITSFHSDFTYRLVQLCGMYFWKFYNDPNKDIYPYDPELNWEGPQRDLKFFYGQSHFSNSAEATTDISIYTSLDNETIFWIISKNFCPITLNGVKYIHKDGKYVQV